MPELSVGVPAKVYLQESELAGSPAVEASNPDSGMEVEQPISQLSLQLLEKHCVEQEVELEEDEPRKSIEKKGLKEVEREYLEMKELISQAVFKQAERHMELSQARHAIKCAQVRASSKSKLCPNALIVPGRQVLEHEEVAPHPGPSSQRPSKRLQALSAEVASKMRLCQGYRQRCEHEEEIGGCGQCVRQRVF